ncbi:unnamed protein product [Eruca vesicaria subsp. sativa]|uniref:PGG domain-containing protein n=1 Tax=Eruca vesicaria subsp. sativa TaxID=29727 RepID=A0ABC8J7P1_ERUVS|nr:unnamed protein product [Eruca vesicaria subsp. sativa]
MSIVVDVSDTYQDDNIYERIKKAAQDGDIERLYKMVAEDHYILKHYEKLPFCETPLHVAAEKGHTHFAMEVMTLKPSLALKLNPSGFSPMHLALLNNHIRMARGFIAIDSSLVSVRGRGGITPLHHVARLGDAELLGEMLCAFPSSVDDLTIKCETAVHIAVKNHRFEAFRVLFGWVKRSNREEVLDWKDEDGNTVLHIAALTNQPEVMKLLRGSVKSKAKNNDNKTAKDILQTHQSHLSPKPISSSLIQIAKERLVYGTTTTTLAKYLSTKPSFLEKLSSVLGLTNLNKTRQTSPNSDDSRSVILVVAVLIVTATYQANLSPPGGFWQEDSKRGDRDDHLAGQMTMTFYEAIFFYIPNGIAFFLSLYVIMILTVGLPMWKVLYGSIAALGIANFAMLNITFPTSHTEHRPGGVILNVFLYTYPAITAIIVFAPFAVFFLNKWRRRRVDFPARYFTSPHELS